MLTITYFWFPLNKSSFYKNWFKKLKLTKTFVRIKQLINSRDEGKSSTAPGAFFVASNAS